MYYYPNPNQFQPQQIQTPQAPMYLKGRPVTSIEEVKAAQVDFDGSLFLFPDIANNRIYTKQINLDGTSSINLFELSKIPVENKTQYVTKEEFDEAMKKINTLIEKSETPPQPQQFTF